MVDRALNSLGIARLALLDKALSVVQDLPDNDGDPVSHGPDGLDISQANYQAFEDALQMAVFGSGSRLRRLAQQPSHEAVAFGRPAGVVLPGTLAGTGADANPGSQLRR